MRLNGLYIPVCLLIALALSSCSSRKAHPSALIYGFKPSNAEFNLGDAERFEFRFGHVVSDGQRRLLMTYDKYDRASGKKLGGFFRLSTDAGASFGPEWPLPPDAPGELTFFAFTRNGLVAVYGANSRGKYAEPN